MITAAIIKHENLYKGFVITNDKLKRSDLLCFNNHKDKYGKTWRDYDVEYDDISALLDTNISRNYIINYDNYHDITDNKILFDIPMDIDWSAGIIPNGQYRIIGFSMYELDTINDCWDKINTIRNTFNLLTQVI